MFRDLADSVDFSAVFAESPTAMCVFQDDIILACNDAAYSLFAFPRKALIGKSWAFLYPSDAEFTRFKFELANAMGMKQSYVGEKTMKRCTGELFGCRVSAVAMTSRKGLARQIWAFSEVRVHRNVYQTMSPREREVAALLVTGNTSKMIAGKVGLSPRTVEFYRRGLMQKLSATSFSDLICQLINDLTVSTALPD